MITQRQLFIAVILLTLAAWGCWQTMEIVPDYSLIETPLHIAGYVLCGLALFAFINAMRKTEP